MSDRPWWITASEICIIETLRFYIRRGRLRVRDFLHTEYRSLVNQRQRQRQLVMRISHGINANKKRRNIFNVM